MSSTISTESNTITAAGDLDAIQAALTAPVDIPKSSQDEGKNEACFPPQRITIPIVASGFRKPTGIQIKLSNCQLPGTAKNTVVNYNSNMLQIQLDDISPDTLLTVDILYGPIQSKDEASIKAAEDAFKEIIGDNSSTDTGTNCSSSNASVCGGIEEEKHGNKSQETREGNNEVVLGFKEEIKEGESEIKFSLNEKLNGYTFQVTNLDLDQGKKLALTLDPFKNHTLNDCHFISKVRCVWYRPKDDLADVVFIVADTTLDEAIEIQYDVKSILNETDLRSLQIDEKIFIPNIDYDPRKHRYIVRDLDSEQTKKFVKAIDRSDTDHLCTKRALKFKKDIYPIEQDYRGVVFGTVNKCTEDMPTIISAIKNLLVHLEDHENFKQKIKFYPSMHFVKVKNGYHFKLSKAPWRYTRDIEEIVDPSVNNISDEYPIRNKVKYLRSIRGRLNSSLDFAISEISLNEAVRILNTFLPLIRICRIKEHEIFESSTDDYCCRACIKEEIAREKAEMKNKKADVTFVDEGSKVYKFKITDFCDESYDRSFHAMIEDDADCATFKNSIVSAGVDIADNVNWFKVSDITLKKAEDIATTIRKVLKERKIQENVRTASPPFDLLEGQECLSVCYTKVSRIGTHRFSFVVNHKQLTKIVDNFEADTQRITYGSSISEKIVYARKVFEKKCVTLYFELFDMPFGKTDQIRDDLKVYLGIDHILKMDIYKLIQITAPFPTYNATALEFDVKNLTSETAKKVIDFIDPHNAAFSIEEPPFEDRIEYIRLKTVGSKQTVTFKLNSQHGKTYMTLQRIKSLLPLIEKMDNVKYQRESIPFIRIKKTPRRYSYQFEIDGLNSEQEKLLSLVLDAKNSGPDGYEFKDRIIRIEKPFDCCQIKTIKFEIYPIEFKETLHIQSQILILLTDLDPPKLTGLPKIYMINAANASKFIITSMNKRNREKYLNALANIENKSEFSKFGGSPTSVGLELRSFSFWFDLETTYDEQATDISILLKEFFKKDNPDKIKIEKIKKTYFNKSIDKILSRANLSNNSDNEEDEFKVDRNYPKNLNDEKVFPKLPVKEKVELENFVQVECGTIAEDDDRKIIMAKKESIAESSAKSGQKDKKKKTIVTAQDIMKDINVKTDRSENHGKTFVDILRLSMDCSESIVDVETVDSSPCRFGEISENLSERDSNSSGASEISIIETVEIENAIKDSEMVNLKGKSTKVVFDRDIQDIYKFIVPNLHLVVAKRIASALFNISNGTANQGNNLIYVQLEKNTSNSTNVVFEMECADVEGAILVQNELSDLLGSQFAKLFVDPPPPPCDIDSNFSNEIGKINFTNALAKCKINLDKSTDWMTKSQMQRTQEINLSLILVMWHFLDDYNERLKSYGITKNVSEMEEIITTQILLQQSNYNELFKNYTKTVLYDVNMRLYADPGYCLSDLIRIYDMIKKLNVDLQWCANNERIEIYSKHIIKIGIYSDTIAGKILASRDFSIRFQDIFNFTAEKMEKLLDIAKGKALYNVGDLFKIIPVLKKFLNPPKAGGKLKYALSRLDVIKLFVVKGIWSIYNVTNGDNDNVSDENSL